jgi:hypothetical protein
VCLKAAVDAVLGLALLLGVAARVLAIYLDLSVELHADAAQA